MIVHDGLPHEAEKEIDLETVRVKSHKNPIIRALLNIMDIIAVFRPLLLIPVWLPAILGFWTSRIPVERVPGAPVPGHQEGMGYLFLTVTLLGASVYIINQIFDIEADRIGKKHLPIAEGLVSKGIAWTLYIVVTLLALFFGFTWTWIVGLLTLLGVVLGVLYSVPPIALKDRAVWGLVSNALGHGALIFIIGYFWTDRIDLNGILSSIPYLFAYGSVYIFTTIPDREADSKMNKQTIAVKVGVFKSTMLAVVLLLIAIGTGLMFSQPAIFLTGFVSLPFFLYTLKDKRTFNRAAKIAITALTFFTALFYPWFIVLFVIVVVFVYFYNRLRYGVSYP